MRLFVAALLLVAVPGALAAGHMSGPGAGSGHEDSMEERRQMQQQMPPEDAMQRREDAAARGLFGGFHMMQHNASGAFVHFRWHDNGSLEGHRVMAQNELRFTHEIHFGCSDAPVRHDLGAEQAWSCREGSWHVFDDPNGTWMVRAGPEGMQIHLRLQNGTMAQAMNQTRVQLHNPNGTGCLCVWGDAQWQVHAGWANATLGPHAAMRFQGGPGEASETSRLRLREQAFVAHRLGAEGRVVESGGEAVILPYEYAARLRLREHADDRLRFEVETDAPDGQIIDLAVDASLLGDAERVRVRVDGREAMEEQDPQRLWQGEVQGHAFHWTREGDVHQVAVRLGSSSTHEIVVEPGSTEPGDGDPSEGVPTLAGVVLAMALLSVAALRRRP